MALSCLVFAWTRPVFLFFFFEDRFSFDVAGETGSFAKTSSVIITVQITLLSEQDGALEECLCQAGMLVCPELAAFLRA